MITAVPLPFRRLRAQPLCKAISYNFFQTGANRMNQRLTPQHPPCTFYSLQRRSKNEPFCQKGGKEKMTLLRRVAANTRSF